MFSISPSFKETLWQTWLELLKCCGWPRSKGSVCVSVGIQQKLPSKKCLLCCCDVQFLGRWGPADSQSIPTVAIFCSNVFSVGECPWLLCACQQGAIAQPTEAEVQPAEADFRVAHQSCGPWSCFSVLWVFISWGTQLWATLLHASLIENHCLCHQRRSTRCLW